ncbi:MAG: hypothetical protein LBQ65_07020 [Tannerellaceae bacterium]|jgi:hypothetical protein|nr:hypothetical protein [Tannerellaceae bacterium]
MDTSDLMLTKAETDEVSLLEKTTPVLTNAAQSDRKVPEGYLTGDEFVKQGKDAIATYYKENGLL